MMKIDHLLHSVLLHCLFLQAKFYSPQHETKSLLRPLLTKPRKDARNTPHVLKTVRACVWHRVQCAGSYEEQ